MRNNKKGFTLIELLIVVAIIAILAAIAIPNFIQAQIRAKVTRAKADIRSLATGLESYFVDNNAYPDDTLYANSYYYYVSDAITTPIAYLSGNYFVDPFRNAVYDTISNPAMTVYRRYRYKNYIADAQANNGTERVGMRRYGSWRLSSSGPDRTATFNANTYGWFEDYLEPYDPTNGTVSNGDVIRAQNGINETRDFNTNTADY